jgi:hypothetical protein
MLGSAFWPGFVLVVVALPGDVVHVVLVAGWVLVAGGFVVRAATHLLQPAGGRATGETFLHSGSGPPAAWNPDLDGHGRIPDAARVRRPKPRMGRMHEPR